ncbi:MAG TPA: enoyl-ACP reductase FabI [Solirubrobacteraceae bacterium]|nr:enoyl-ACP reductase FabI [Solirubrobacteraceae bacterium]
MQTNGVRAETRAVGDQPGAGLLAGKKILVTGVITKDSIAFSAAAQAQRLGAEVLLTSFGRVRRMTERAARSLPMEVPVLELDVSKDADFDSLGQELGERWGQVDGVLHSIAFAPGDALGGNFMNAPRASALAAFEVSAYSLAALGQSLAPLMSDLPGGASIVGLDFDASVAWPGYDWMGVAKAALESVTRYMATYLGPKQIRVNLIAAGPLRTVASSGVPLFGELAGHWSQSAPLGWEIENSQSVAGPICFLLSDLSTSITGEIIHVDGGAHAVRGLEGLAAQPPSE